ncbi:hypothetical protein KC332_g3610 [Hortaea werneckii]|uniref:Enoyl reductase (ER) domain-containing protein n=1 Tax=Hortaea werneckii EXF-2000 TaxID=1157616 RepID=A0A1Z5TDL2_HORWE|nr:hypothetical protein KC350_g2381 [Hortaea werneckii]OTA34080.1 hypothetical protein BTJ68_05918 [Hortaea werneckii EXF-2000]KAI6850217.1 hypothetical protein KC358_g814 [Hortaea werneckii]KAI6940776.1 hypothetical protein KC348_g4906 [Hortaea werneckii]KAI6941130.1 hypothetical protein KC341_g3112 [Hortaea werneckii]
MPSLQTPSQQTAALVRHLGGPLGFVHDWPVPQPGRDEILAKVLYTGVCQSDLHTQNGTAAGMDGEPITKIKLPHIGGHEGVGRIVKFGPGLPERDLSIYVGALVGIRQRYCQGVGGWKPTNHLHHEDGAFQEYIVLDAGYLTLLPADTDPVLAAPTLCAGLTAYKAVLNANVKVGDWLVVVGAGGGLGQYAVQYARNSGAKVVGIDTGEEKKNLVESFGATFLDFRKTASNLIPHIQRLTQGGAHSVIVCAGSSAAFAQAASMLRVGGTLCCIGIPPGGGRIETSVAEIVIKGIKIQGNLVGNLKECLDAVKQVTEGLVRPKVYVRPFEELPAVYEEMEKGEIAGRVVLKIGDDPRPGIGLQSRL